MSTAQSLIDDVRARIVEANADFFADDVSILRWLNQGYRNFSNRTGCLEKVTGYTIVANQYEYSLPSDNCAVQQITWKDQYFVRERDLEEYQRLAGFSDQTSDRPRIWSQYPVQSKFRVYPIPSTASYTTTVNGAQTSATTSILVADTTNFPTRGRILIGTEQIQYFAKDSTHFLQCIRGDGETTAAALSNGGTVTELPMLMRYIYIPPAMTTGGSAVDCRLPVEYEEAVILYATALCFRAKDKYETAGYCEKKYKEILEMATSDILERQRDRLPAIKEEWDGDWI